MSGKTAYRPKSFASAVTLEAVGRDAASLTSVMALMIGLCMGIFYVLARVGFAQSHADTVLRSLALLAVPLGAPSLVRRVAKVLRYVPAMDSPAGMDALSMLGALLLLVGIGLILPNPIGIAVVAILALACVIALVLDIPPLQQKQWAMLLGGSLVIGIWSASYVFGSKLHDPLFIEVLPLGQRTYDPIFHIALAQNLNTYGVVSSGLDGVPVFHYHAISHWIFLRWASAVGETMPNFYLVTYPIMVVPLFFKAFLNVVNDARLYISERWNADTMLLPVNWFAILVCIIGCVPTVFGKHFAMDWGQPFASESNTLSLIILFVGISILTLLNRTSGWARASIAVFLPIWTACMTGTKVSLLGVVAVAFAFLFARTAFFRRPEFIVGFAASLIAGYLTVSTNKAYQSQGDFRPAPGDLFSFIDPGYGLPFVVLYFMPIWASLVIAGAYCGFKKLLSWRHEPEVVPAQMVAVQWLVFFILVNSLRFEGGNGIYFLEPVRWLALGCFLAMLPAGISLVQIRHLSPNVVRGGLALVAGLLVFHLVSSVVHATNRNLGNRRSIANSDAEYAKLSGVSKILDAPQLALDRNPSYQILQELEGLQQLPVSERRQTLLFIPQNCDAYWKMSPDRYGPFIAPALSGMAMIDGMPPAERGKMQFFGYEAYVQRAPNQTQDTSEAVLIQKARALGFERVMTVIK